MSPSDRLSPSNPESFSEFDGELASVVLVGGKSSRMGQPKSDLLIGEETFLERIVGQVKRVTSAVVIVGDVDQQKHRLPQDVMFHQDERSNAGPVEGIRVGLKALAETHPMAFVTCCDSPLLKTAVIKTLFRISTGAGVSPFLNRPEKDKRIYGLTAIYPTSVHPSIDKSIQRNRLRVCDIVLDCGLELVDVERLRKADPELDSLFNVNTIEDYKDLKRKLNDRPKQPPKQ